ncbi:hypothetical protein ACFE04_026936 [Oxalis oulophora]
MTSVKNGSDDEYSVIKEKGEIGFIDYANDLSVLSYDQNEEGPARVSVPFPFVRGKPQSVLVGDVSKCSIIIENPTSESLELGEIRIYSSQPDDSFTLSLLEPPSANSSPEEIQGFVEGFFLEDRVLQPYETLTVWLSCKPKEIGLQTSVVHFDINYDRIERVVFLLAENKVCQSMSSRRPYTRAVKKQQFSVDEYVGSLRPKGKGKGSKKTYMHKLPEFPIPKNIREQVENKQIPNVLLEGLTRSNYQAFFSTLLVMEELQLEEDMRCHNMEGVAMKRKGTKNLALEVPGLAEKRPSLVHGDHVFIKLASGNGGPGTVFQGYINRVEADEVLLTFAEEFHISHMNRNLYDVQFAYCRVNMRRLYHAVYATTNLEAHLLFPTRLTKRRLLKPTPFVPFTCNLNKEQRHCVEMILDCHGAPPFAIYGPPGTGKTSTLVEAIIQIYTLREKCRILVCAASNSAADHILEKLIENESARVKDDEILRLNAASRSYDDVQSDHIQFCHLEDSIFKCPPLNKLMRYRVVITTYISSSLLYLEGVKNGHFSHIFLDEAGQASEPECMVPISTLCKNETVVVLAGDPKQLGPVIFSKKADELGLGKSYLERLFESEHYDNEDSRFVVKLVRNYRSHPVILDLPSKLFYKGELLACKEDLSSARYEKFDLLPSKNFPVLFFGIQGCDEREGNNPSWFNRVEAGKVVEVISKLIETADLNETDIGVITPYRQQVLKIRQVLEAYGFHDIKVGSVEQFQGQEKEVIIVSTVRSTIKHNDFDKFYCLGFLSNPRRCNVAITRAKSLLIIVGNPHIVCQNPYWDKLLKYCMDNNSYLGCRPPEREDDEEQELAKAGVDNEVQDSYSKVDEWCYSVQDEGTSEVPGPFAGGWN